MQVCEIESSGDLEELRPEWIGLWQRATAAGPFQHPDWLLAWWRHFGGRELLVVAVRDRDRLVAVAPFYIYSDRTSRARQLTLLGNGISDSCDVLVDPTVPDAGAALADRLLALKDRWSSYDFRDVPNNSALLEIVRHFGGSMMEDTPCVTIPLHNWLETRAGPRPARVLADLRRCRRRAEELGSVRIEGVSRFELSEALEGLFRIHACRWSARGQSGVLNGAELRSFHREVAERFAERKWLRLYRLLLGGRLIAANYGFCVRSRAYSYIGGFDPAFAELSPGKMIVHHFISDAAAEGAIDFDFLRGAEGYKYRWGGKSRVQYHLTSSSCSQEA